MNLCTVTEQVKKLVLRDENNVQTRPSLTNKMKCTVAHYTDNNAAMTQANKDKQ